ncbi:MAG: 16S rRNA (cytosine(967)-C(5))-methyltransferase RsmB [Clostridia bacterium]|nr:16S rRNA (cytosine(967)-C(5))-methyltransferase RsmB [Clostridia bacterium]
MTEKRPATKKPFRSAQSSEKKPLRSNDKKPFGKPAGDRKFGKPAGDRKFGKPAPKKPEGERLFGRSAKDAPQESTGLTMNARRVALDVLCDVHQNGAFAALSLDEKLRASKLSPQDRSLVTNIVYGTLENELRIDYALDKLMDHPTHQPSQRDILRMSAYQILFLDRVPDSAAVNEAVKLVKAMNMEAASGFVNAVLRNLSRGKEEIGWPKKEDDLRTYLSIMGSMPMWLVDRLIADYGAEEAERVILYRETEHPIVVRPNFNKLSDEEFEKLLAKKEWRVKRGVAPHAWLVYGAQEITFDPDYKAGLFSIQGQSSMLAAEAVQVKNGMKVLDACAAPGGKSAYLCEKMQLTGRVFSWELHEKRALLLEGVKRRLGLDNMRISVRDAGEFREDMEGTLDAVLLDAPCAGLGVLAQKPDVKLRLKAEDIPAIVETQKRILETVCRYVKKGGTLVYSTCSILPEENAQQVQAFLDRHPEYELQTLPVSFPEELRKQQGAYGLQLLGSRDGVEGFFIARMRRVR